MRLLSRPRPNKLESLRGYILRLSQANSYHTTRYVLEMADLWKGRNHDSASSYVLGNASLAKLAKIANIPLGQLEALRYGLNQQKQSIIHSHKITNEHLRLDYPRICPLCLDTNNIALAVWDIPAITVCPEHRIPLFDHCPECDTRLRWNRPGIHLCHYCECDFRNYSHEKVLLPEYRLSRLAYQLCMKQPVSDRAIPVPLKHLNLKDVLALASAIALLDYQLSASQPASSTFLSLKTAPNHVLHEHYNNAMGHLDNWPANFYQFLADNRQTRRSKGASDGISKEIGPPFYWIKANRQKTAYKPFWEAYCEYRKKATKETIKALQQGRIEADYISIRAAARELNVRPEQLHKFCKRLKTKLRKGRGNRRLIARTSLPKLQQLFNSLLTINQVANQLGITAYQMRGMIHKSIITPFRGPSVDKSRDWCFEPQSIQNLQTRLQKQCKTSGFRKTHKLNLKQAIEQISYYRLGLPELVAAILSGKVKPALSDKKLKLSKLVFAEREVKALRPDCQSSDTYWQPPDIQQHLGCKRHIVFGMINTGQLQSEKVNLPGRTRPVVACKKADIIAFSKQYLLQPLLAEHFRLTPKPLEKLLAQAHINPVSGPTIDGGYCCLYLRKQVKKSMLKKALKSVLSTKKLDQAIKAL